jgi:ubiquinone/menaquinone biosynthesis C-methylase UbiE
MHTGPSSRPPGAGKSSFDLVDAPALSRALALKPGGVLLDMGCGAGAYTLALAEIVGDGGLVYAVDLWAEGIRRLREEIGRRGMQNVRPIVADIAKPLPLPGGSMDLILMATVLHDLDEGAARDGALAEVRRLLKPGGVFAVVEFKKIPGLPGPPVAIRLSPEDLEEMVVPFGFVRGELHEAGTHLYLMTFVPRVVCCG